MKESSGEIDFVEDQNGTVSHLLLYRGGLPTKAPRK
jgi:hypothetical protein